ncbi:uncharacterized protein LOC144173700 [Haemaphysalis longicornis]
MSGTGDLRVKLGRSISLSFLWPTFLATPGARAAVSQAQSPRMLFFIASCYTLCAGRAADGSRNGIAAAAEAACNEPFRQSEHFAAAFKCARAQAVPECDFF